MDLAESETIVDRVLFEGRSSDGIDVSINPIEVSIHVRALPSMVTSQLSVLLTTEKRHSEKVWPEAVRLEVADGSGVDLCVSAKDDSQGKVTREFVEWFELTVQDQADRSAVAKHEMLYSEGRGFCKKNLPLHTGVHEAQISGVKASDGSGYIVEMQSNGNTSCGVPVSSKFAVNNQACHSRAFHQ